MGPGHVTPSTMRTGDIVLPPIRRSPHLPIELSGLMPNRDHNGDLLSEIERLPHCLAGEWPVFGILAADPFLRIDQMARRLRSKGYGHLANLPSAGQYGAGFRMVLGDLKLGPSREREVLKQFAELGFTISVAIAQDEDIMPSLALDPVYIFIVPSFDLWTDGTVDSRAMLDLCAETANKRAQSGATAPIILFGGRLGITTSQAQDAGADGALLD